VLEEMAIRVLFEDNAQVLQSVLNVARLPSRKIQMIGAIAGDIIGSVYEWKNIKTKQFVAALPTIQSSPLP
jgi:hypothetical protein